MAFKRRRLSRGRYRRRRTGRRAFRIKKLIKRTIRRMQEVKFATTEQDLNVFDGFAGYLVDMTPAFAQGVTKFTRIGDHIRYKNFQIKGMIGVDGGNAPAQVVAVRLMIFTLKIQPGTAALPVQLPGLADIFLPTGAARVQLFAGINPNGISLLKDKIWVLGELGTATNSQIPSNKIFRFNIRMRNRVSFRNAAQQNPTDPRDRIFMYIRSNNDLQQQNNINIQFTTRMSFYDL